MPPIGLDATYSIGDGLSGVGVYSREILFGLARAYPQEAFRFWYRPHRYFRAAGERFPANVRRRLLAGPLGPRGNGLFHGLNQRLPDILPRRRVATFHDLFVLTGEYSTAEFRARFAAQARDAAQRADAIIAVSAFTAEQVVGLLGVERSRVSVVHHGVSRMALPEIARERIILSVGAIQKRKNTARLVEAFQAAPEDWTLVLAGSEGYGAAGIRESVAASPVRSRIRLTGYVRANELAELYARASIFAFPSLDEGFGMPVLDAMAAGIPVIVSDRSALPEVAGEAAVLVDPTRTESIAAALVDLARNEDRRADLAVLGRARAAEFSWEKAVEDTWRVYRGLSG